MLQCYRATTGPRKREWMIRTIPGVRGRGTGGEGEEKFTEAEGAGKVGAADP